MSADTMEINRTMKHFDEHDKVWLFGYGSLIYKADFPFIERTPAHIRGWARRFWQGSHDHRGTPDKPGRVVTLVEAPGKVCEGMAYLITPEEFAHLDFREKNGYLRIVTTIYFQQIANDGEPKHSQEIGVVYIAAHDNDAFLGPASEKDIARNIAQSEGPSGKNSEYLLHLADALRELNEIDEHVFEIERHLLLELTQKK